MSKLRGAWKRLRKYKFRPSRKNYRRVVVVGDLHGDYFRLVRILEDTNLVRYDNPSNPYSFSWRDDVEPTDLVFIGDYIDWRGEPLEGPIEEWKFGAFRILFLIGHLKAQLSVGSKLRVFTLIGNHEDMMLRAKEGYRILSERLGSKLSDLLDIALTNTYRAIYYASKEGLTQDELKNFTELLNWYLQGGRQTIESFGSIDRWLHDTSEGEIKRVLDELLLLVKLDDHLFLHTLPDKLHLLVKLLRDGPAELSDDERQELRNQLLWSRGLWGIDAFTNREIVPPSIEEIRTYLEDMGIKRVVLGHTPLRLALNDKKSPIVAFEGMIVNTDLHGIPYSEPYIEYLPADSEVIVYEDKTLW